MAVVEEYESPSSPDELLLSTMAKVWNFFNSLSLFLFLSL
jgi:hypothetical protein